MIELFPAKCPDEVLRCGGCVWAGIIMNHHNTLAKHATSPILVHTTQFLKCVTIDTCVVCGGMRQQVHKQNAFSVPKHCAHDLPSWSGLLEFHLCWRWSVPPLCGLLLRFRGCMRHPCLIPCDYTAQKVITFLTVSCQKVQHTDLPFPFVFFVSIFSTQPAHNFRNLNLFETISWRSDREIWGKCRESDIMVNRLFSLIFSSTACTKSSFSTDGWPLHRSSCTFSRPSLNSRTHLRTIELLMACSPYTSQSWQWISAGFVFFAFKKQITDRISHAAWFYVFLNVINTQHDV